jgi:hypothetical protein
MPINTEVAGLIVAVGFFLMGLVTLPILVLAAVPLGIAVALLLRYQRRAWLSAVDLAFNTAPSILSLCESSPLSCFWSLRLWPSP